MAGMLAHPFDDPDFLFFRFKLRALFWIGSLRPC